jgi:hypothetical protein
MKPVSQLVSRVAESSSKLGTEYIFWLVVGGGGVVGVLCGCGWGCVWGELVSVLGWELVSVLGCVCGCVGRVGVWGRG